MLQSNEIKRILEGYIKCGFLKFAIYPFGDNGVLVKNLLKDYFNIEPVYIVDNKYSAYHPSIISLDDLVLIDDSSCIVVLTIEERNLNCQMEEQCIKYFGKSRVINLMKCIKKMPEIVISKYLSKSYCQKAFDSSQFFHFASVSKGLEKQGKIKVRFFHHGAHLWNAYQTVYEAFRSDSRFDVLLISYCGDYTDEAEWQRRGGAAHIEWCEYKPHIDLPDIFIYTGPFMAQTVKPICDHAQISFIIPLMLMVYSSEQKEGGKQIISEIEKSGVDYCLAEKLLYNDLPKETTVKVLEFGNPKFDVMHRLSVERNISNKFDKMKHKKVILFTSTHGNSGGGFGEGITFDLYAEMIFEFAFLNSEIGLIFRPHPLFIAELIECCYWTEKDVARIKKYINSTENMIWDDNDTYEEALMVTDAIITDGYCGIKLSALPLMKPICALYRNYEISPMCPQIDDNLYIARNEEELNNFLVQVVGAGHDGMLNERKKACYKFIKHFDGKNGQRIKDFITKTYFEL